MNVNFYYVQSGSSMPTTYVEGAVYFDANTNKLYRAKSTTEIEAFGGSDNGLPRLTRVENTYSSEESEITNNVFANFSNAVNKIMIPFASGMNWNVLNVSGGNSERTLKVWYGDMDVDVIVPKYKDLNLLVYTFDEYTFLVTPAYQDSFNYDSTITNTSSNAPEAKAVKSYVDTAVSDKVTAAQVNALFSYDSATQTLSITTLS